MRFEKDGTLLKMTRMQMQQTIMQYSETVHNFDDEMKGIHETLYSVNERIKSFNKKVAYGKADAQILIEKHKNGVDAKIRHVQ